MLEISRVDSWKAEQAVRWLQLGEGIYALGINEAPPYEINESLRAALRCFEWGLELDPCNLDLLNELADHYGSGQGTEADEGMELRLICFAALLGSARSQTALGYVLSGGLKGTERIEQAIHWFRKAAIQGDEIAINALRKLSTSA